MKVLVSDPITKAGMTILKEADFDVVYLPDASDDEKADACKDVHGWVVRSGTQATANMINSAENLQVIGRAGVGTDNIDISAATRKGIVVMNTPDVNTISAAEHTVAMMLALSRNIPLGHGGIIKGQWNRNALVGTELRNKTLGVVGLGKIGREVIQRSRSFNMNILGFDPYVSQDMFDEEEVRVVDLDTLTSESDYITLHVPFIDSTKDLFDFERLCRMKDSARIINVARGGIINEADLAKALNEDKIAGAAIDVFTSEPIGENNPLVKAKNIVMTPHLGASTAEAKEGVSLAVCEQVRDYLLHEKLANAINMPISDLVKLKEIQPNLDLSEAMGKLQSQLETGVIQKVHIECAGSMEETKPAMLAFLKGLLSSRIPDRVNYVNAESLALDLGIKIEYSYSSNCGSYENLIRTQVTGENGSNQINGSIFENKRLRLVKILGYEMDITPRGTLLFVHNKDVPGVVGKVGTALGSSQINIGAYILSRDSVDGEAFAVIRVDNEVPEKILTELADMQEIISIQQINC
ncbi:MAG TPA: phosphoglycerate dehydrogenase [Candidatus Marinimicrobia bacterium]|jgi:D-3-phosphoglycerate dehydrogenase|nr:phosphoglycerate dehydrogenase [Candidatus Neomarinimicrobiota bacterium]MDP7095606.1 phosphoglycerate dehydrogenase [Candidatus Neomarinimicrobiota bacterium]MDP7165201.1 phosphoglycerate dehydrogenase [Candidatus Neomarinimicrobiota bacterium]MDP7512296.1 phosphoglycerate dehydrogenase [Candidatus Neomarinimicrobiota bacterium]HBR87293.1 phosphoglycerate dehydrogenase [Candidatus Neomarinimicrobiota bacterium]